MWYDFEHRRSFKLAETTLDSSIAPIESKTIELRGNACTTWGDSIAPATVLWVNVPLFNDLMKEWLTRKQELASGTITKIRVSRMAAPMAGFRRYGWKTRTQKAVEKSKISVLQ